MHENCDNNEPSNRTKYTYDAENRIASVNGETGYVYDAAGNRVEKFQGGGSWNNSSPAVIDVLTLDGKKLGDMNSNENLLYFNIYAPGGRLVATYGNQSGSSPGYTYNLTDWLGTKRMQVTASGDAQESCISNPFGDGLSCSGSATDATEQHFTGKERDSESGNDYFGARYYASSMGRFLSPDWAAKISPVPYAVLDDPQSLNLYAYVRNNPLSRADADGHSDYLWQKVKNWAEGNGYRTNAQVQGLSVAQTAANHKGSMDWAINTNNSSGKDVGHPQDFHSGQDKCNQFVGDTLAEAGKTRPEITDKDGNTRMPNAHELADPNVHIPGLSDPKPLADAKPGDVIAQEHGDTYGHTGIVVGPGQTASANATGSYGGQITVNNWGFRPAGQNGESATDPAPVVRTPQ